MSAARPAPLAPDRSRTPARPLALACAALALLAGCAGEPAPPEASSGEAAETSAGDLERLTFACVGGQIDAALVGMDSLIAAAPTPEAHALRAGCRRQRFARDSARADAEGALTDLDAALETASGETAGALYSQRAFTRLALRPDDFVGAAADLDRALEADPGNARHLLDRGTARALAGAPEAARADYEAALVAGDSAASAEARQRLAGLR